MSRFKPLSDELIREILCHVQPEEFENFAQTSKNVFLVAQPFLKEHRRLIQQYHTLKSHGPLDDSRDGFVHRPIPTFLTDVLLDPRIGHYIRTVDVGPLVDYHHISVPEEDTEESRGLAMERMDPLDNAAAQNEFLIEPGFTDEPDFLWRGYFDWCGQLHLTLLLTLLPNLTTLSIDMEVIGDLPWLRDMIQCMPEAKKPILTNLRSINLEASVDNGVKLVDLISFNSLPSLRATSASGTWDCERCEGVSMPPPNCRATHLTRIRSTASSKTMRKYLQSFDNLETFTLDVEECDDFDPLLIRRGLQMQSRATLQSLTILCHPPKKCFMGSLREFEALREVTTERDFLCPIDGHTEEQSKWPFQVLPYTLRTLKLRDKPTGDKHDYVGCYKELVQGLVFGKESAFPFFESLDTFDVPQGKTFES